MAKKRLKTEGQLISAVYKNPKYSGKHVVIIGGKVYKANTGPGASQLLEKLIKKHPKETPLVSYVPDKEALILIIS